MDPSHAARLAGAPDYTALFRLVKDLVERRLGRARAGLMLGLAPLGLSPQGYIGGFFQVASNAIILNRDALEHVRRASPAHHNAYAFSVLLHEYLHTLGWLSEQEVRPLVLEVSQWALGPEHLATRIADAMTRGVAGQPLPPEVRDLLIPEYGWVPQGEPQIEFIRGFDPDATPYIG